MNKNKFFSVNMSTTEDTSKTQESSINNNNSNNNSNNNNSNNTVMNGYTGRIKFNENDIAQKHKLLHKVTKVEDPDSLFGEKKEKFTQKDFKTIMIPAIALIVIAILNEIFIVPLVIENVVKYVLHGKLELVASLSLNSEQMISYAGLIVILAYSMFSIALVGFSIINIFKRVYTKNDLVGVAAKIMLYTFLIGFIILVLDCIIPANISELVVKATSFGMHSLMKYIK